MLPAMSQDAHKGLCYRTQRIARSLGPCARTSNAHKGLCYGKARHFGHRKALNWEKKAADLLRRFSRPKPRLVQHRWVENSLPIMGSRSPDVK